jgi:DNA-binding NarL/FixJ family response regulator
LHETLSDREFQVLRMMASGKTITEVARELSLSVKTVSTYRARILEKLMLKNSAEAIRYAVDHQLVD